MNIDKDIEILKEMQKDGLQLVRVYKIQRNYYKAKKVKQKAQAISNVLSELESYKGKIILSDEEYNQVIENAQKDIKKEAETWKKIAEKLESALKNEGLDLDIDWAKKEVDNGN